jgi:hypothetical protein
MEPEQAKNLPYSGTHKGLGNILVPAFGAMLLGLIVLEYLRAPGDLGGYALIGVALPVIAVGSSYVAFRRILSRLDGSVKEETVAALCSAANSMVLFGYLACLLALAFFGKRH